MIKGHQYEVKGFLREHSHIYNTAAEYERDELEICISISEPSVGASACVPVASVYRGIDWEHHRVDINSAVSIVRKGKSIADVIEPWVHEYDYEGKKKTVIMDCRMCGGRIRKEDKYCPKCGQKLK